MTRRLVLSYLAITVLVLAMLEIPLAVFYSQREEERFIAAAERDAVVLGSFYEDVLQRGLAPDPTPSAEYGDRTTARVVLVDTAGISVLDTQGPADRDFSTRPEIQTALTGIRSSGIRRSDTLDTDLLYVAVPVASGGNVHGSLRLTIDAQEVTQRIQRFWIGLLLIAGIVLLAVAGIGWGIARSVAKPIRSLQNSARRFAEGDLTTATIDRDAPAEVVALGSAMNSMAERLGELISAQREFVSDASHQLRTPLTALRLRLENIETQLPDNADILAATNEVERLSDLVNDILQLARAEQYPPAEPIEIGSIAADRVETWTAVAADVDVTLELHAPSGPILTYAIPGAVEQLLDNAIDNALSASPPATAVEVHIEQRGMVNRIVILDHGPGLSDLDKENAPQRFWRGANTQPGTGLGLAIAHALTSASGGQLQLEDTPGGGLTVIFELPAAGGALNQ